MLGLLGLPSAGTLFGHPKSSPPTPPTPELEGTEALPTLPSGYRLKSLKKKKFIIVNHCCAGFVVLFFSNKLFSSHSPGLVHWLMEGAESGVGGSWCRRGRHGVCPPQREPGKEEMDLSLPTPL